MVAPISPVPLSAGRLSLLICPLEIGPVVGAVLS